MQDLCHGLIRQPINYMKTGPDLYKDVLKKPEYDLYIDASSFNVLTGNSQTKNIASLHWIWPQELQALQTSSYNGVLNLGAGWDTKYAKYFIADSNKIIEDTNSTFTTCYISLSAMVQALSFSQLKSWKPLTNQ